MTNKGFFYDGSKLLLISAIQYGLSAFVTIGFLTLDALLTVQEIATPFHVLFWFLFILASTATASVVMFTYRNNYQKTAVIAWVVFSQIGVFAILSLCNMVLKFSIMRFFTIKDFFYSIIPLVGCLLNKRALKRMGNDKNTDS